MEREYTGVYSADERNLSAKYLEYLQRPGWKPMAKMPYNAYGDQALCTNVSNRNRYKGTYTVICPECGLPFTEERTGGGRRTYHPDCAVAVRERGQRESKRKSAAKMKGEKGGLASR